MQSDNRTNANTTESNENNPYNITSKMDSRDLFPFKPKLINHVQKLIQYWHDCMDPSLRFVYCADGSIKFTTISDEEYFKNGILNLYDIDKDGFSTFKNQIEMIINSLQETEKGIAISDTVLQHALTDLANMSTFPYYNKPLRLIQKYMNENIHSDDDIKLIWHMMTDNGFYIQDEDEPDLEYRTEYVDNLGIILVLSICQRQIEHWEYLQNGSTRFKHDEPLGVLVDLVPIMISAGRTGKSTFLQNLALNTYHTDGCQILAKGKHRSPETAFFQPTMGKLVSELNELLITPENIDEIKDFISRKTAIYANLYEEKKEHPLTAVYVGTSNNPQVIYGMENIGRFAPIYHKKVEKLPYSHDENGICTDDYFLRILAEGLYLIKNKKQTWKQYYTPNMKEIQKTMAKSVSYHSSLLEELLLFLENCFSDLEKDYFGQLESFDNEEIRLLKKDVKERFFDKYIQHYDKKEIQSAWKQLENDMNPTTGRQTFGYAQKRVHDIEENYNLTHDYIVKLI